MTGTGVTGAGVGLGVAVGTGSGVVGAAVGSAVGVGPGPGFVGAGPGFAGTGPVLGFPGSVGEEGLALVLFDVGCCVGLFLAARQTSARGECIPLIRDD